MAIKELAKILMALMELLPKNMLAQAWEKELRMLHGH